LMSHPSISDATKVTKVFVIITCLSLLVWTSVLTLWWACFFLVVFGCSLLRYGCGEKLERSS
jgi:hypothetical protein